MARLGVRSHPGGGARVLRARVVGAELVGDGLDVLTLDAVGDEQAGCEARLAQRPLSGGDRQGHEACRACSERSTNCSASRRAANSLEGNQGKPSVMLTIALTSRRLRDA